jgi:hypothetical protein
VAFFGEVNSPCIRHFAVLSYTLKKTVPPQHAVENAKNLFFATSQPSKSDGVQVGIAFIVVAFRVFVSMMRQIGVILCKRQTVGGSSRRGRRLAVK